MREVDLGGSGRGGMEQRDKGDRHDIISFEKSGYIRNYTHS